MTRPTAASAILIIDLCGFSRSMEEQGVTVALAAVARLQNAACAAAGSHQGRVVKCWADNVMAIFPTVDQAARAAAATIAILPAAAGIGFGEVLDTGTDLFGVEVNNACRLGEDVAKAGEVLLTEAARVALSGEGSGGADR